MATKANPGPFDCYEAAEEDEPLFVLLARDRHAPPLIALWSYLRALEGEDEEKVTEAMECAKAMIDWATEHKGQEACSYRNVALAAVGYLAQMPDDDVKRVQDVLPPSLPRSQSPASNVPAWHHSMEPTAQSAPVRSDRVGPIAPTLPSTVLQNPEPGQLAVDTSGRVVLIDTVFPDGVGADPRIAGKINVRLHPESPTVVTRTRVGLRAATPVEAFTAGWRHGISS